MSKDNRPMRPDRSPDRASEISPGQHEETFLQRWARRKGETRAPTTKHDEPAAVEKQQQTAKTDPAPSASGRSISRPDKPALPPIERLDENSDYSAFMSPDVSEDLRRLALRKLFHSPKFNVVDPVDQFVLDWNGFEPLGDIVTHEMRAALEREAEQLVTKARETLAHDQNPDQAIPDVATATNEPASTEPPPVETLPAASETAKQETGQESPVDAAAGTTTRPRERG